MFFQENLNQVSEIWNSIANTRYGYINILARFQKTLTFTNQGDPYIIWTRILRRSRIWSQKSEISSVTAVMVLFAFLPHCGKIWPPPIRMRYISSEPEFWGDSRSEVRNLKFYLLHLYLANYCFNIYFNTVFSISWNLTIRITCQTYRWHISIYWSQIRWSPVKYFTTMFPQ